MWVTFIATSNDDDFIIRGWLQLYLDLTPLHCHTRHPHHLTINETITSHLDRYNSPHQFATITTHSLRTKAIFRITYTTVAMFRRIVASAPRATGRILASVTQPTTRFIAPAVVGSSITGRREYHEKVLDHYSRPRNVGSMSKADADVGTGLVGAPACGDVMKLQIRVDPSNNTISDVKFKTFGCGSAIASSSYLTELVRGMTLEEAGRVRNTEIAKELCLPPVKRTC